MQMIARILGFGNLLRGDDGVGIHVLRRLAQTPLPQGIELIEVGVRGIGAVTYFEDCDKVILVDALEFQSEVGRVHRLKQDEIACPEGVCSAHAMDLGFLLHSLPLVLQEAAWPEVVILGVEIPGCETFTDQLSPAVEGAIEAVLEQVRRELSCS